jgi:hypothetical protein
MPTYRGQILLVLTFLDFHGKKKFNVVRQKVKVTGGEKREY